MLLPRALRFAIVTSKGPRNAPPREGEGKARAAGAEVAGRRGRRRGAGIASPGVGPKEDLHMLFQLRTDNHIKNSDGLADRVRANVEGSLTGHYAERVR